MKVFLSLIWSIGIFYGTFYILEILIDMSNVWWDTPIGFLVSLIGLFLIILPWMQIDEENKKNAKRTKNA